MSGKYALLNEWLGNRIGYEIGIKTQLPKWVEIDNKIETEDIYIEVKELINKSLGVNIGFDFRQNVDEIKKEDFNKFNKKDLNEIFLFDLVMINIDRSPSNINLMKSEGEIYSIDYESSFLVQEIIENRNLLTNPRILQSLRNNPLYQEVEENVIDEFLKKINRISINEILSEIPEILLPERNFNLLSKKIEAKQRDDWSLKELLKKLKTVRLETQEEQMERSRKNRDEFKRKFKKNSAPNI